MKKKENNVHREDLRGRCFISTIVKHSQAQEIKVLNPKSFRNPIAIDTLVANAWKVAGKWNFGEKNRLRT